MIEIGKIYIYRNHPSMDGAYDGPGQMLDDVNKKVIIYKKGNLWYEGVFMDEYSGATRFFTAEALSPYRKIKNGPAI